MSKTYEQTSELAVALLYDGENAPRIQAKGRGELAHQILELAEKYRIPLEKDPQLASILAQIPLGDEIPESLYRAIAEVITFAYLVSGKRPPGFPGSGGVDMEAGNPAGCGNDPEP